jgi:hypothetical protein
MTHLNQRVPHSTFANRDRARRPARPLREARMQRIFEGVVASYIRDISGRIALAPRA